jgi:phage terminase large subunit-like protein
MLKHKTLFKTSSTESLLARAHSSSPVVARYCLDVLTGNVPVGRLVYLAVERHVRDLVDGEKRGLVYDDSATSYVVEFFEKFLVLAEGEHAGKPFLLSPWQQFVLAMLFGWKTADGFRRFRTAYLEIGKGNGKSPLAAGILLFLLIADGEESAEIYSAAVTKDQAKILFRDAENMRAASPWLRQKIAAHRNNLSVASTASFARPISSEKRGLDGKRVHGALIDELHEHPSDVVVNKMRAGTKGRRQALIFMITNSGFDRETVCYYQHEYSRKVLESIIEAESHFAYVCHLDACEECQANGYTQPKEGCNNCDSWLDRDVWIKANPNLGISIGVKYLDEQIQEAVAIPTKEGIVRRLNLCFWTQGEKRAIGAVAWARCAGENSADPVAWRARKIAELRGRNSFVGVDLGSTDDISGTLFLFPVQAGVPKIVVLPFFYCPEDGVALRTHKDRIPYRLWAQLGFLKVTPGNVRDDDFIRKDIADCGRMFNVREVRFDPYRALLLVNQLQADGFNLVEHRQGFISMTDPVDAVTNMIKKAEFEHGGNPVLTWMADNLVVTADAAGNKKPVKPSNPNSPKKIDGMVALMLAKAAADANPVIARPRVHVL